MSTSIATEGEAAPAKMREPMFAALVRDRSDTTGLLAFALYEQTRRDWIDAFENQHGRAPGDAEVRAFTVGEHLPRRIESYRLLAEEMLSLQKGGEAAVAAASGRNSPTSADVMRRMSWRHLGLLLLLVVAMAAVFRVLGAWLFRP